MINETTIEKTKSSLLIWTLAIHLIYLVITALAALALIRYLDVSYKMAWNLRHKIFQIMKEQGDSQSLAGIINMQGNFFSRITDIILNRSLISAWADDSRLKDFQIYTCNHYYEIISRDFTRKKLQHKVGQIKFEIRTQIIVTSLLIYVIKFCMFRGEFLRVDGVVVNILDQSIINRLYIKVLMPNILCLGFR